MSTPDTFLYNNIRTLFATGGFNWATSPVNAMLVNSLYVPSLSDQYVSAIPPAAIIARDQVLTGVGQTNGVCYGNIPQWDTLIANSIAVAVVLYSKLSTDPISPLIYYGSNGPGFPLTLQGFNYFVGYDSTQGGWFQV